MQEQHTGPIIDISSLIPCNIQETYTNNFIKHNELAYETKYS